MWPAEGAKPRAAPSGARRKAQVNLGDQVFVPGEITTSQHGELSSPADEWVMEADHPVEIPARAGRR